MTEFVVVFDEESVSSNLSSLTLRLLSWSNLIADSPSVPTGHAEQSTQQMLA